MTTQSNVSAAAQAACPCGTKRAYEACCGLAISGAVAPETAEALLRARYTAYTKGAVDFVLATHHSRTRGEVSAEGVKAWADGSEWLGLEILSKDEGGPQDERGSVRFRARYRQKGQTFEHLEIAFFERENGEWRFVTASTPPATREKEKVGRNEPCPCGSGKKFKKCCG
jgi:SEC-C motif-containing protein